MFLTVFLLLSAIGLLLWFLHCKSLRPSGLPRGPKGWPIIGNLNLVYHGEENNFHELTARLGRQYGGMFSLQYAQLSCVVLTDYRLAREALVQQADVWSDRPLHLDFLKLFMKKAGGGIIMQNGDAHKEMKRLAVKSMRDLGLGKQTVEEKIKAELEEIILEMKNSCNACLDLDKIFRSSATNIICNILFGNRYNYDDSEFVELMSHFKTIFEETGFQNVCIYLPWYAFWLAPILQPQMRRFVKARLAINDFVQRVIAQHRMTFDPKVIRNFIDMYLSAESDTSDQLHSEQRLLKLIMDLFMAGAETTGTTFKWALLFLVKHPEVQDRCRQEILQQCGSTELPSFQDRVNLPYVDATLCEVLRLGNPAPLPIFHNTAKTADLNGYTIPQNTLLCVNHYAIHTDANYWPDPLEFRPERFLNENGIRKHVDSYIPFGIGRRSCTGEGLARIELFVILTGLLQRFKFHAANAESLPSVSDAKLGFTLIPPEFKVYATKV